MARYSKAIAAGVPSAVSFLNLLLPVTSGNTKLWVSAVLAVLTLVAVYAAPKNAESSPAVVGTVSRS